jgi:hypothetical protein
MRKILRRRIYPRFSTFEHAEPTTEQFQGFLNLWSRRLRRHIPRVFAEIGAHGREGFDPTQDRKAF